MSQKDALRQIVANAARKRKPWKDVVAGYFNSYSAAFCRHKALGFPKGGEVQLSPLVADAILYRAERNQIRLKRARRETR